MVIVKVTMFALPEKQLEVKQTLISMIEPVAKEAGCLSYSVLCDIEDKNCFSLLGKWKNRKALDLHIMSNRFGVLLGSRTLLSEPLLVEIHTVSKSEGMDVIHTVRYEKANSRSSS
jgi:quinol monooxygenase YgiN